MSGIIYFIAIPFIYLVSVTPFWLLYGISDGFYALLYRLMGYRKKVVITNLKNAFPEKTDAEINRIAGKFYHHLCDLFLETFKTLTISKKSMLKHCRFSPEAKGLFDQLADDNQSIILAMGHQGNWEWAGNSFSMVCRQQLYVIYHPLSNKYFNGLIYRMRTRFKTKLIAMRDTYKDMVANKAELNATAFIADQTPAPNNAYWTTFLNQDTPVFQGTERIARKLNYPVVYAQVKKVKRGHYEIFAEMLVANPAGTQDGEISELYTRRLEKDIIAQPETWLWSHRRWKHKKPANTNIAAAVS